MENNLGKKIIGKPSTPQKVAEASLFFNPGQMAEQ